MTGGLRSCHKIVLMILNSFSNLNWSKAASREDMNGLWVKWVDIFNSLVEKLIGTRLARVSSWGRKFDINVRRLCKKASIARAWLVEAKHAGRAATDFYLSWKQGRI